MALWFSRPCQCMTCAGGVFLWCRCYHPTGQAGWRSRRPLRTPAPGERNVQKGTGRLAADRRATEGFLRAASEPRFESQDPPGHARCAEECRVPRGQSVRLGGRHPLRGRERWENARRHPRPAEQRGGEVLRGYDGHHPAARRPVALDEKLSGNHLWFRCVRRCGRCWRGGARGHLLLVDVLCPNVILEIRHLFPNY